MPELHEFRMGGTGISALAFADDSSRSFPDEWEAVAFLANPISNAINAVKIFLVKQTDKIPFTEMSQSKDALYQQK